MISFNSLVALGPLAQLNGNRMEIPLRRSTRAIQIMDANHVLERLDEAEKSFCPIRTRYAL